MVCFIEWAVDNSRLMEYTHIKSIEYTQVDNIDDYIQNMQNYYKSLNISNNLELYRRELELRIIGRDCKNKINDVAKDIFDALSIWRILQFDLNVKKSKIIRSEKEH